MRSLIITPMLPVMSPADTGGKHRRAGTFIRAVGRLSSRIDLVYIVPERLLPLGEDVAELSRSQSAFWGVPLNVSLAIRRSRQETRWSYYGAGILDATLQPHLYPYGGKAVVGEIARHLDTAPDLVLVDRIDGVVPILQSGRRPKVLLLDVDDVYHKVLWRSAFSAPARPTKWLSGLLQMPSLIALERRAIAMSTLSFVCSATDRRHLRRLGFGDKVRFIPNAITVPQSTPGVPAERTVLFLGSYHHSPNVVAVERLVRRIWPMIRSRVPDARLLIAGADSHQLPSRSAGIAGVEYLGFVDDLAALYERTRVVCCPITTGSGTRLKLVEAASFARPMVSTRMAAEGLEFRNEAEILLREDDGSLAEACIALLGDDGACHRLGMAARETMRHHYDVEAVEQQITKSIDEALGTDGSSKQSVHR